MARVFLQSFAIPDESIDVNGHVNNQEYVRWMQDIAVAHSNEQGWTLARYFAANAMWVIRSHYIEYIRPAFKGDQLIAATWVPAMEEKSAPRKYRFVRKSDGKMVVDAVSAWVYCNAKTGRPTLITDDVRTSFPLVTEEKEVVAAINAARL